MTPEPSPNPGPPPTPPRRRVLVLAAGIATATLAVHARSLVAPYLLLDDFIILDHSYRWADARAHLWVPVNEHCWPLFRLATWAVAWGAGGAADLPVACALAVRAALLAAVGLVYLFVRRERGHPFYGLAAAAAFGVTAVYQEAVNWYAASPAIGAVAFTMLSLLAAQRWVRHRSYAGLVGSAVWSFLAPGWYGGGILTGPLCGLYLVTGGRRRAAAVPVLGSLAFLALALAQSGDRLLHAEHHDSRTTLEALSPVAGLVNTARSVVDNLAIGAVGVAGFTCPPVIAAGLFLAVAVGVGWWWGRAPRRDLLVLGAAFVVLHFGLVYAARAAWPYDTVLRGWSRYNLFPWLGVVLGLAGGLKRPGGSDAAVGLTAREARLLGWVVVGLMVANLPRGVIGTPPRDPEQPVVLKRVDEMDERCRAAGISAGAARGVLDKVPTPGDRGFNAWRLLRGSDHPRPLPDEEVRRLLNAD